MSSSGLQRSSTVAQTCNLMSQYFKDNGRFATKLEANKGVETSRQQSTTMNLLPNLENSAQVSRQNDFFASFASSNLKNEAILEHGTSQMTILYAGKVFVFSDFPAEKAKEIVAMAATKASSNVVTPDLNMAPTTGNNNSTNNISTPAQFKRASLKRFFEKRKDRAAASAPYQVKNHHFSMAAAAAATPKPEDQSKSPGLELEDQLSKQLDLNL